MVRQGLSGLAQVSGRNSISWEDKINYDLKYVENISFWGDIKIIIKTVLSVFKHEGINQVGQATSLDLGDYLLCTKKISKKEFELKQKEAK